MGEPTEGTNGTRTVHPWCETECERCGMPHQATRAEPRVLAAGEELLCSTCSAMDRAYAESAQQIAELKAVRDQLEKEISGRDARIDELEGHRVDLEARVESLIRAREELEGRLQNLRNAHGETTREAEQLRQKILEWEATAGDLAKSYDALKADRERIGIQNNNLREIAESRQGSIERLEEELLRLREECTRYRTTWVPQALHAGRVAELEALREQLKGSGPVVDRFNAITQDLVKQLQNAGDRYRATIPGNMLDRVDKLERWSQFTENRLVGLENRVSELESNWPTEGVPTLVGAIAHLADSGSLDNLTNGELEILKAAIEREVKRGQ